MSKRIAKLTVGIVLTAIITFGAIFADYRLNQAQIDAPSETFVGEVSAKSYNSKTDAVRAFVSNELTGETASPKFVKYEKIKDLSQSEIQALSVEEGVKESINSAENVLIYYSTADAEKGIKANLLTVDGSVHYYVTPPEEGDALTNAYYQSVTDGEKYLNCTAQTTVSIKEKSNEAFYSQEILFDNDLAYFNQKLPGMEYEIYFAQTQNQSIETYIKHPNKSDGKFYSLSQINSELSNSKYTVRLAKAGKTVSVDELKSMKDVTGFIFLLPVDASYFVKTPTGFKMTDQKFKAMLKLVMGEEVYNEVFSSGREYQSYFDVEYVVSDGRISKVNTVIKMSDGEELVMVDIKATYTKFGKTQVTLPNREED